MNKINLIKKLTPNSQWISIDLDELEILGGENKEGIEDTIKENLDAGHALITITSGGKKITYMSKETDGLVRDMEQYLKDNEFNHMLHLDNTIPSQSLWEDNVYLWYEKAIEDDEFKAKINAKAQEALTTEPKKGNDPFDLVKILEESRNWLATRELGKRGSTGQRKSAICQFITNWVAKAAKEHVRKNKVWKKKW